MRIRKTTPEKENSEREADFLKLSGVERLRVMRAVSDRMRKPGVNYELKGLRVVKIKRP